jgi:hypothetical protein
MRRNSDSLNYQATIDRFRRARSDPSLVALEGFHALKHALRFAAAVLETVTVAPEQLIRLTDSLAPDLPAYLGRTPLSSRTRFSDSFPPFLQRRA